MPKNLGSFVPGADVRLSFDLANKVPAGATLSDAAVNMRRGADAAQVTKVSISGTDVYIRVRALAYGTAVFDIVGTFSNGDADGEECQVSVE